MLILPNNPNVGILQPNKHLSFYQERGIIGGEKFGNNKSIYSCIAEGKRNILAVSPGGSGKTVIQAKVAFDFISTTTQDVAIFVHRKELLNHSRLEILDWYGLIAQKIDALTKNIPYGCRIFVCMVETFSRRSVEAFLKYFSNVGLYMVDECHLQHFSKIFKHFPNAIRVGFTATPISGDKLRPLNLDYDDIVIISEIPELVELNRIEPSRGIVTCEDHCWTIDIGVNYGGLKVKRNGEYDETQMGSEFSKKRQIQNTIDAYEKYCLGQKTIIFNANIDHSLKLHNELNYYYPNWSQHIDSDNKSRYSSKQHREYIFGDGTKDSGWMNQTENAILNNVGIAAIGTDIKSVRCVLTNHSTKSFTKYWQEVFRANRAYVDKNGVAKEYFTNIDTGNNILSDKGGNGHGVYWDNANFDWETMFRYPQQPRSKAGVCPIKVCPECKAIVNSQTRICLAKVLNPLDENIESECGYIFSFSSTSNEEDITFRGMIKVGAIVSSKIDVSATINYIQEQGKKQASGFYEIIKQVCCSYKKNAESEEITKEQLILLNEICYKKISEWFKLIEKRKYPSTKDIVKNEMLNKLQKLGYEIDLDEVVAISELDL